MSKYSVYYIRLPIIFYLILLFNSWWRWITKSTLNTIEKIKITVISDVLVISPEQTCFDKTSTQNEKTLKLEAKGIIATVKIGKTGNPQEAKLKNGEHDYQF